MVSRSTLSWHDTPYEQRLTTAKQLMREAGYGPDHPLRLTIRYNTSENYKRVAVAVQDMWRHIGVEASLENCRGEGPLQYAGAG